MDIVHELPTTILYSLEAFRDEVDWNRMMKLQCEDGSFLTSPCSTAACVLHTRDEKALGYLRGLLAQFNNGVPHCYPFELLEHLWMVDRIQRLGIDRYFKREIRDCLERVYKYVSFIAHKKTNSASTITS
jgi:ent-copalyl diphosphate synthase